MLLNWTVGEYAHPNVLVDRPLRHIAVGVTAVVGEATDPSALGGVDELQKSEIARAAIMLKDDVPRPSAAS